MSAERSTSLLRAWCDHGVAALAAARAEIDAINVYPVADGDTGTNLLLTLGAARAGLPDEPGPLATAVRALATGALLGARGNSGVILAQFLQAAVAVLGDESPDTAPIAAVLDGAATAGYAAVAAPVEGTMLTVMRAAADGAQSAADAGRFEAAEVLDAAAAAARRALAATTSQLPALAAAGVVDAGGQGVSLLLDVARDVALGRLPVAAVGSDAAEVAMSTELAGREPTAPRQRYEVMYLLDAQSEAVAGLRARLSGLGDSVVVVGGDALWSVHVHAADPGAAIEAGLAIGRPHRIRVTALHEPSGVQTPYAAQHVQPVPKRGVVAFAAGEGLGRLFADSGATVVERPAGTCSADEIRAAIVAAGAPEVVVLPNQRAGLAAAEAAAHAARADGVRAAVIPTHAQVQGLAALAVHDPDSDFDDDVVTMSAAAGHTRHGAVTVATQDAMTMAGPCRRGDMLGIVDGDFAVIGGSPEAVAGDVVDRLLAGGGELVTLVSGRECPEGLIGRLADRLEGSRADLEVVGFDGGQPRYLLLVGVE